jgi:hypothetical protein
VDARTSSAVSGGARVLLIGNDELTDVTHRALRSAGSIVTNLREPSDTAIRTALGHAVDTASSFPRTITSRCATPSWWRACAPACASS